MHKKIIFIKKNKHLCRLNSRLYLSLSIAGQNDAQKEEKIYKAFSRRENFSITLGDKKYWILGIL